jgi:hypothetical protein
MKQLILILALVFLVDANNGLTAQTFNARDGYAVIISKYSHDVSIWGKTSPESEYFDSQVGELHRVFPTGPKLVFGDGRIPNGIFKADLQLVDGNMIIDIPYETSPGVFEHFRITGPSLSHNSIPLKKDIYFELRDAALAMMEAGHTQIPVVILPGNLEPEVADLMEKSQNVREGYTLDDVKASCNRWRPVENYLIRTGRIPGINAPPLVFDGTDIILPADPPIDQPSESVAQRAKP